MKSFKSLFLSEDQLDESVGPWRPEDQVGKNAHAFHRAQWDHHMDQKKQGKHKGFKQLQKGVVYQSNSGTWVGQRNGIKQREYFPSRQQAEHWVNGTMPNKGGISFLSRDKKYHDDSSVSYDHGEKEIPGKFQHAPAKMPSEKPKKVSKPKPKVEKPKQTEHQKAQKLLDKSDGIEKDEKQNVEKEKSSDESNDYRSALDYDENKMALSNADKEKVKDALFMTKQKAKERAQQAAELGIGAGNAVSQAGECCTVYANQRLLQGASEEQIRSELNHIVNSDPNHVLNNKSGKEWIDAGINCANLLHDTFGDNIADVAWDTDEGNLLMNTTGHGTAADMVVKLSDGTRVGVSLKKDGAIRIHNGGYAKVMNQIKDSMRERGIPEETINKVHEATNVNNYWKDVNGYLSDDNIKDFLNNPAVSKVIKKLYAESDDDYETEVLGDAADKSKYLDLLEKDENGIPKFLSNIQRTLGPEGRAEYQAKLEKYHNGQLTKEPREGPNENDLKVLSKIAAHLEKQGHSMDLYSNLRDADVKHFGRMADAMKSDSKVEDAFKDEILHGLELDQILGLEKNPNLDKLMVVYGVEPRGSELSEEKLMGVLGKDSQKLLDNFRKISPDDHQKLGKAKKALMDNIKGKIEVDYTGGDKTGTIKFIKDVGGGKKSEFPLFTMGVRTKGIGVSPGFEMVQTGFMGNALEHGFDITKWPEKTRKKWWNDEMNRTKKQLKDLDEENEQSSPRGKDIASYRKLLTDRISGIYESFKYNFKSIAHTIHEIIQPIK